MITTGKKIIECSTILSMIIWDDSIGEKQKATIKKSFFKIASNKDGKAFIEKIIYNETKICSIPHEWIKKNNGIFHDKNQNKLYIKP